MKVIFLNTSERTGGAAVAAGRLRQALNRMGVQVDLLVREDTWLNRFRFYWERLVIFLCNHFNRKNLFTVSIANTGKDVSHHPLVKDVDIIHLHWINQGFLSLKDIRALVKLGKPIVWTMHDMWPATGICHYSGDCDKYQLKCERCPLQSTGSIFDLARWRYKRKKDCGLNQICFVGCSRWIMNVAQKSSLLKGAVFYSIPNSIDTKLFRPMNKQEARSLLNLPENKILLLFAAAKISDKRKGISYLVTACSLLKSHYKEQLEVLLLGTKADEIKQELPFKVHTMGYISDNSTMVAMYSCADLFVVPSLEDNLPNTIMESLSCGTPCVGFRVGGIPEMIDHKQNGYLANYKDADDLAAGIQWVLDYPDKEALSKACVEKVKRCYSEEVVAGQYKALYEKLLKINLE